MADSNVEPVVGKLEDLPEALRNQLSKTFLRGSGSVESFVEKLEPILKNGGKNLDEVILAWWQEYNEEILTRQTTRTKLNAGVKQKLLTQPSKSVYGWPEKEDKKK